MRMVLMTISVVMTCGAVVLAYSQYRNILGKEVAEGRVIELEPRADADGGATYAVVATFVDRQNKQHIYRSAFSGCNPGYRVGDRIRIYFTPGNPSACGVLSFGYRFGLAWALLCGGLALALFQIGFNIGSNWLMERFPTTVYAQPISSGDVATRAAPEK